MIIDKLEQNINDAGEHRITFTLNIDGTDYQMTGFLNNQATKFEFAKNEVTYLACFIEENITPAIRQDIKAQKIADLEKQLKALKG